MRKKNKCSSGISDSDATLSSTNQTPSTRILIFRLSDADASNVSSHSVAEDICIAHEHEIQSPQHNANIIISLHHHHHH